jgi:hypothetical protein
VPTIEGLHSGKQRAVAFSGLAASQRIQQSQVEMSATKIKRKFAFALLVSLVSLCGCAHQYLMKLSNGDRLVSVTKPKLQATNYYFRDASGQEHVIPQSRVAKIETGWVVKEKEKPLASPARPKRHKHWYLLWLA